MNTKKQTVLITGGAKGIGAATARLFAANGYKVIINYRTSQEKAKALASEIGGFSVCADVSNPSDVRRMFNEIDKIDILINNAGICGFYMLDEMTDDEWRKQIDTNLSSVFYCSRSALPNMIHNKCGAIINVSSVWGVSGSACEVAYSAAKAGVIGFTKALAKEVGPSGIRVNCVAPGVIDTEMNSMLSADTVSELCDETPLGRLGRADEVANTIYYLAQDNTFITGQIISPNGGIVI